MKWVSALDRQGEVGFAFAREHHGHGYATEAAAAMLRLGFDELDLHRITAVCIEQNEASARVLQRLGFSRQGRLVDSVFFKGQWATQLRRSSAWCGASSPPSPALPVWTTLDALRAAMLPQAVVTRTCGRSPAVYSVESFIAPRRPLLTDGSLTEERPGLGPDAHHQADGCL